MTTRRRHLLRAAAATALLAAARPFAVRGAVEPRIVEIVAHRFTYEPSELTLKVNEPVVFRLSSLDVVMGFSVPDFAVRGTIVPGRTTEVPMTPTKIGDFVFLCDVFCGSGHEEMEGTLRVVT